MNTQLRSDQTGQSKEPGCSTTDFTYDKLSKVFICANEKALFTTYEKDSKLEPSARLYRQSLDIPEEYIQAQEQQHIPSRFENENSSGCGIESYIDYTRFSTSKSSQQGIAVSASGLSATCKGTKSVNSSLGGYSYAIGCKSFEQNSEYYVEMFLPNGCEGVELGVVLTPANLEAPQFLKTYLVTYKYKTAKTIGLKIDTKQWGIKVWMNGVYEPFKAKRIPKGSYALCLKMNLQGVTCIINPYAQDPERTVSPFMLAPSSYSLQQQQQQQPQSADNSVQELLLKLNQGLTAVDAKQQARKDTNNEQTDSKQNSPSKNLSLNEIIYLQESSNLIAVHDNKIKLLRRNTQGKFDLHYSHFLNKPSAASDTIYLPISLQAIAVILNCQHLFAQIPSNLSTIFLQALLKAVSSQTQSDEESQIVTITAPFNVIKSIINAGIYVVYSHVSQLLELVSPAVRHPLPAEIKKETQKLIGLQNSSGFDLSSTPSQDEPSDGLPFFPQKALLLAKDEEPVSAAGVEKDVPSAIASVSPKIKAPAEMTNEITNIESEDSIKKEATSSSNNNNSNSLSNHSAASELTSQDIPIANIKELNEKWDLKQLQDLLIVLQRIDEQLFAMTLHEDVSVELRKGFQTGAARVFSSFGRLLSFYTSASSVLSLERLAEAGLVNIYDLKSELRHFLDLNTPVRISRESENNSVEDQIESQLDLHAASSANIVRDPNITLDITVNAAPYGIHKNADNSSPATGVSILRPSNQYRSNYVCTMGSEGTVNIWNARFMLQRLAISDFKSEFVYPSQCEIQADLRQNEDALNSSKAGLSSNSNAFQSYLYKILENSISDSCKYAKKPKPTEKQLSADSDKVEHLLQLGFSISVAKKACIEVKNESLEKAVDAALRIKEEEMKQTKPANQKGSLFFSGEDQEEIHVNSIKPFWSCELCTYQNTGEHFQCEVCLFQAPESAYYSQIEVEVIMNERKQQKELEEQKALQEILQKEEEESRIKEQAQELVKEQKLKEQLKNEQIKSFINSAAARNGFILNTADPSFAQLLVGVALNLSEKSKESLNVALEHKSLLRIRRFATNPKALNQFYSFTEKGIVSNISGQYLQESSVKGLEKLLLADENNRFVFESLAPLAAENASLHELLAVQEANIFFDDDTIIDSKCRLVSKSSSTEEYELVILGASTSNSYNLHVYSLKIDTQDIYNLSKKPIETTFIRKIRVGGSNTASESASLVLAESSSAAVIVAGTKLIQIPLSNSSSETIQIQELNSRAVTTCFVSGNQIAVLDESSAITLIDLSSKSNPAAAIAKTNVEASQETGFVNQKEFFSSQELKYLEKQLISTPASCFAKTLPYSSTRKDFSGYLSSKHTFKNIPSNKSQKFEFEFAEPIALSKIHLELALRRRINKESSMPSASSQIQTQNKQKQQSSPYFYFPSWQPQGCEKFLPLRIVENQVNNSQSEKYQISSVLFKNKSIFQTINWGCPIIATHAGNNNNPSNENNLQMCVESVSIESAAQPIEGGFPVGTVLVFACQSLQKVDYIAKTFSQFTQEDYLNLGNSNKNHSKETLNYEITPIACVQFNKNESYLTVQLNHVQTKYLVFLPTQLRKEFNHLKATKCLSLQFIGVTGSIVAAVPSTTSTQEIEIPWKLSQDAFTVEAVTSTQSEDKIKRIEVTLPISMNTSSQASAIKQFGQSCCDMQEYKLNFDGISWNESNRQILNQLVHKIRVSIDVSKIPAELNLDEISFSAESFADKELNSQAVAAESSPAATTTSPSSLLKNNIRADLLLSSKLLDKIILNTLSKSKSNSVSFALLIRILELVDASTLTYIYSKINFQTLVQNLITSNSEQTQERFSDSKSSLVLFALLITRLQSIESLKKDVSAAILSVLPNLLTLNLTPIGLKAYLSLLKYIMILDPESQSKSVIIPGIINALKSVVLQISNKRDPARGILARRFGISSVCFEQTVFNEELFQQEVCKKFGLALSQLETAQDALPYKVLIHADSLVSVQYIDLKSIVQLHEISLVFQKNKLQCPAFTVSVYAFSNENNSTEANDKNTLRQVLVGQQQFGSEVFAQMADYSWEESAGNSFDGLVLSLPVLKVSEEFHQEAISSRYLIVQIAYSLRPFVGTSKERNDLPNSLMFPIIKGTAVFQDEQSSELPNVFPADFHSNSKNSSDLDSLKTSGGSLLAAHFAGSSNIQILQDSAGVTKIQNTSASRKSSWAQTSMNLSGSFVPQVDETQRKLRNLLLNPEAKRDQVLKLVIDVETLLATSFLNSLSNNLPNSSNAAGNHQSNSSDNSSYLYALSQHLSRFLRASVFSPILAQEEDTSIALDIFDSLVAQEGTGAIQDEAILLLVEYFIPALSEQKLMQFILSIIEKYLMTQPTVSSQQVSSIPASKLEQEYNNVSIVNVLKALQAMKVPYSAVMSFLVKKLSENQEESSSSEPLTYSQLAPVLALLYSSIRNPKVSSAPEENKSFESLDLFQSSNEASPRSQNGDNTEAGLQINKTSAIPQTSQLKEALEIWLRVIQMNQCTREEYLQLTSVCFGICKGVLGVENQDIIAVGLASGNLMKILDHALARLDEQLVQKVLELIVLVKLSDQTHLILVHQLEAVVQNYIAGFSNSKRSLKEVQLLCTLVELLSQEIQKVNQRLQPKKLKKITPKDLVGRINQIITNDIEKKGADTSASKDAKAANNSDAHQTESSGNGKSSSAKDENSDAVEPNLEEQIAPVGIQRSLSASVSQKNADQAAGVATKDSNSCAKEKEYPAEWHEMIPETAEYVETCIKAASCSCQTKTVSGLIDILEQSVQLSGTVQLSDSSELWSVLMQLVENLPLRALIDSELFARLSDLFLQNSSNSQNTPKQTKIVLKSLLIAKTPQFLGLCNKLFSSNSSSDPSKPLLCYYLLETILSTINSGTTSSTKQTFIQGWLDILASGQTPRPEGYYLNSAPTGFCCLSLLHSSVVLLDASKYLLEHCSPAGNKGVLFADNQVFAKFKTVSALLQVIFNMQIAGDQTNAKLPQDSCQKSAIKALFAEDNQTVRDNITKTLANLVRWYILNRSDNECINVPVVACLNEVSEQVKQLIQSSAGSASMSKICLRESISACRSLGDELEAIQLAFRQSKNQKISSISPSAIVSWRFVHNAWQLLEDLFDLLVTSDEIASFAAFEISSFQFFLSAISYKNLAIQQDSIEPLQNNKNSSKKLSSSNLFKNQLSQYIDQELLEMRLQGGLLQQAQEKMSFNGNNLLMNGINATNDKGVAGPKQSAFLSQQILDIKPTQDSNANKNAGSLPTTATSAFFTTKVAIAEEQCTRARQIKTLGEIWNGHPNNWCENKHGVQGAHIAWMSMTGNAHSECCLFLKFDKPVYLSSVRIGFNNFWTQEEDKVLGVPEVVLLEVASRLSDSFTPISELSHLNDPGYASVRVSVAGANFEHLPHQQDDSKSPSDSSDEQASSILGGCLGSWADCKPVQCIKFRILRPQLSFSSSESPLSGKLFNNIAVSISFVSVMAYPAEVSTLQAAADRSDEERVSSAIRLIGRLCSPSFTNTLKSLSQNESVLDKVKSEFNSLIQLLPVHSKCLSSVFSALATNNSEMGDWLLRRFLDLENGGAAQARIASDIICSNLSLSSQRLQTLHHFVLNTALKQIIQQLQGNNQQEATRSFFTLLPFAEAWAAAIRVTALDFKTQKQDSSAIAAGSKIVLQVTRDNIIDLVGVFKAFSKSSKYRSIIRIFVIALNLPPPYSISEENPKDQEKSLLVESLEQLWEHSQTESKVLEIIAPLVLSKKQGIAWLLTDKSRLLLQSFGKLLNLLSSNNPNPQALNDHLYFLSQLTSNASIQSAFSQQNMHINFYNCLKDSSANSQRLLKTCHRPAALILVVEILKNLALASPNNAILFAELLSKDIKLLATKRDMLFVTHLLVPLLNAEKLFPVSFHPFDTISGRWLAEGRKVLEYTRERKNPTNLLEANKVQVSNISVDESVEHENSFSNIKTSLKTNLLWNQTKKNAFFKNFEAFTKKTGLFSKITTKTAQGLKPSAFEWQLVAVQDKDSDPAMLEVVKDKVLTKAPFLILIEGTNQDKKCLSGVFSSQGLSDEKIQSDTGEAQVIPRADDSFMFYYEEGFEMHFDIPIDSSKNLGSLILVDDSAMVLQFQYLDQERILLSYQLHTTSVVDINLLEMTPIDTDTSNFPKDVPAEFDLGKVEYWVLKSTELKNDQLSSQEPADTPSLPLSLLSTLHSNLIFSTKELSTSCVGNYHRSVPVYDIPASFDMARLTNMISVNGMGLSQEAKEKVKFRIKSNEGRELDSKTRIAEIAEEAVEEDGVLDLEFDALSVYGNCTEMHRLPCSEYLPSIPIFEYFQKAGGVQQIIEVIQESLQTWKNTERAARWSQYMKELRSFSTLPNYFGLFMKNKECIELLFELLAGLPDEAPTTALLNSPPIIDPKKKLPINASGGNSVPPSGNLNTVITSTTTTSTTTGTSGSDKIDKNAGGSKKWDEEEQKAVQYSYQVLKDTFKLGQDNAVRQQALDNHLIEAILDRIALVSKEIKRVFVKEEELADLRNKQEEQEDKEKEEQTLKLNKKESDEDGKKKLVTKKGTGYGSDNTGQNQKWNTNEYLESKKNRSEALQNLLAILEAFLDFSDWNPPKILVEQIMSSALLPLIEASLRSGSLLEMSKEKDLVFTYLSLIRVLAKNSCLVPCLLLLDEHYIPSQSESILQLITHLSDTAKIFLNCLGSKTDSKETQQQQQETAHAQKLADLILQTAEAAQGACSKYQTLHEEEDTEHDQNEAIKALLELPLNIKYKLLLQDLRFAYTSFKNEQGKYKHHYSTNITTTYSPPQGKMVRLAQELADLSTALPIDHTNSIFVRCDNDRVDVMKCMVMGAKGTPYAHGAFIFDVYFGDDYPNGPPKCNLETTGSGKVRFNPNLYSCGKVCLSLLGTWRGNASENWDPKISTLLQILVSLQAIIMSEDVYFNEPGFEGEQGTEEGEKKNEAYSNIVRYCNIKYAMIDQIKNPPEGFQSVVSRHFYLKKEEIMEECQKWVKYADVRQASYLGLVNDHNTSWCGEFKNKYAQMLREAVAELEEVLNAIPAPSAADTKIKLKKPQKKLKKADKAKESSAVLNELNKNSNETNTGYDMTQGLAKFEDIDVKYDDEEQTEENDQKKQEFIDINDEKVKDRWSRYIGAMGIDAVAKQSKCQVFMSGLGSLGVEIAKNLVMSGLKRLTLHDSHKTTFSDLSGQFYLGESDIGLNRVEQSIKKIKQLNHYVKVDTVFLNQELPCQEDEIIEKLKLQEYDIVVLTDVLSVKTREAINRFCRSRNIKFIHTDVYGPFCRLFNDFGENFEVVDKNGEDPVDVMIKNITQAEKAVVTLLPGAKHPFEDGEHVVFSEVQGMEIIEAKEQKGEQQEEEMDLEKKPKQNKESDSSTGNNNQANTKPSINGTIHKIRVINSNSFEIGDTTSFTPYIRNGVAKNIKTPLQTQFKSLETVNALTALNQIPFDPNMVIHDFEKIDNPSILFVAFKSLDRFAETHKNSLPECWNAQNAKEFLELAESEIKTFYQDEASQPKQLREVLLRFALTVNSNVGPFAAFLGGFVSQEIVKAITHKYLPTNQLFFSDCMEIIPGGEELSVASYEKYIAEKYESEFKPQNSREDGIRSAVGNGLLKSLQFCNTFMVGCGAIGCELLKNFAMISLGTGNDESTGKKGLLTITDPDHIETSNLNRQFLFREKHLRKPKSQTAAAAVIQMNPLLNGHIHPRLDKVFDGTIHIFSDKFFQSLSVIANALDNVQARRYVDSRCVTNKKPLLESGTLGPKGHVQVILPYLTESYGSQQDPQEEGEIPHCTLKMFPEETLHCIEWARDKFGKLFTLRPKSLLRIADEENYDPQGGQELKELMNAIKMIEKQPKTFDDCVFYAIKKFYKYFRNDIKQLLYTYPLDSKTKDGEPFWKLPKRPPQESEFDPTNQLHVDFVSAIAVLQARLFKIPCPEGCRTQEVKQTIADKAMTFKIEPFKPSEEKAQSISYEVNKNANKPKEEGQTEEDDAVAADLEDQKQHSSIKVNENTEKQQLLSKLQEYKKKLAETTQTPPICAQEFEKDEDQNGHIDLIYAMANCRSANYKLTPMDWLQVKIKAGRIVPALATTTATVAGLQTIELIKILKNEKLSNMKNAFLNLAVPLLQLSEPQKAEKIKIHDELSVTLWDRWEISLGADVNLKQIFAYITEKYKLTVCDVMSGSKLLYASILMDMAGKEQEKEKTLTTALSDLADTEDDYMDFIFTFANEKGEKVKQTPLVRVNFV